MHPFRQIIIQELEVNAGECPLYAEIRTQAMNELEDQLEAILGG